MHLNNLNAPVLNVLSSSCMSFAATKLYIGTFEISPQLYSRGSKAKNVVNYTSARENDTSVPSNSS